MGRMTRLATLALCLTATGLFTGCEREIGYEREKRVSPNGTTVEKETKVTETPGGDIKIEERKDVDRP